SASPPLLLCFFSFIATGGSEQDLQQTRISITKPEGKTVLINCHTVNAAPRRVAYMFSRFFLENQSDEGKFTVEKDPSKSVCTLTVSKVTLQDSATYYCANMLYFPNKNLKCLTTLFPLNHSKPCAAPSLPLPLPSPPKNSEILQKKHENQIMYVCFIEKFYPEVIRVTWTEDEKEVTDNVVKGDTWQSTKEDEYSIASWLTVPAESEDKKYYCKYEHEEKSTSLFLKTVLPLIAYRSKPL
uniref:Uncharacterized protein n=1 Tax=Geospiza parvula TaxID=87175 RepID=A0A8C3M4Y1_GEOPR